MPVNCCWLAMLFFLKQRMAQVEQAEARLLVGEQAPFWFGSRR